MANFKEAFLVGLKKKHHAFFAPFHLPASLEGVKKRFGHKLKRVCPQNETIT